jgi:two-component system, LytTR family, response regulator LytT
MKALIIEDEMPAANRLVKMLKEIEPAIDILDMLDSVESSLNWLKNNPCPDVIFLDIHLADGSCFEIFKHEKVNCPIIFITAYDEYALQAFKVNAVDYLLKPLKTEELRQALDKLQTLYSQPQQYDYAKITSVMTPQYTERFLIKIGQMFRLVEVKDTAYFYSEDKITYLIATNGKRHPLDVTMDKVENMVSPKQFFRINRQFIISVNAIAEMHAHSKSRVKVVLNPPAKEEAVVSAEKSADFKRWLTGEN